ncbi:hypothetical protein EDD22DRAFT_889317, partial [Suillus occidentalis]
GWYAYVRDLISVFLLALSYADTDTDSYSLPVPSDSVLRGCAVDCMLQVNMIFSYPLYTSFSLDFLVENSTSTPMRKRTANVFLPGAL